MKRTEMEKRDMPFNVNARLRSLNAALHGIRLVFHFEHNARIHITALVVAIVLGVFFNITRIEWIGIILCTGLVIVTEFINTSIERIVDIVVPEYSDKAKAIKDISAAAVLLASATAMLAGILIFIPYIFRLF